MNEAPHDWKEVRLGDAFRFTKKPRGLRYCDYEYLPFVPMELIPLNGLYFNEFLLKPANEISSGTYFEQGDVLLAKITPSFENGKQGIIESLPTHFGIATTEVIPINGIADVSHKLFLYYYLLRSEIRSELAGKMEGSTGRQRLNKSTLENLKIFLPPLPVQHAIAGCLRAVREAKETRQRELSLERERKAVLMHQLFTHGTRGEDRKQTEIGEMPESWDIMELGQIAEIVYGVQAAVAHLLDESKGIPILTNINITNEGTIDLSTLRYYELPRTRRERLILQKGDLLFNWRSGSKDHVGKTALFELDGEYTFSSFILRLRPAKTIDNCFLRYFLYYLKTQGFFSQHRQQSSVNSVFNASVAAKTPVCVPTLSEQTVIAELLGAFDDKIDALEMEAALLDELFKSMLEELMTGRLSALLLVKSELVELGNFASV